MDVLDSTLVLSRNESTCYGAAAGGSVECLKFLHENTLLKKGGGACSWNKGIYETKMETWRY